MLFLGSLEMKNLKVNRKVRGTHRSYGKNFNRQSFFIINNIKTNLENECFFIERLTMTTSQKA